MKSKNLKIILIVSTIAIWGIISFKIISFLKKPTVPVISEYQQEKKSKELYKKETFEIVANYRDPFLTEKINTKNVSNNNIENKQSKNSKKPTTGNKRNELKKEIIWPSIKYKGQIFNKNTQKQTGMITINNKKFLVMKEIVYEEIYVDNIYQDSIRLIYQNEVKTFKKK